MKRLIKILLTTIMVTILSSVSVMAGNTYGNFYFMSNGAKSDSYAELKENDGDTYAYITTLSQSPSGKKSTVFTHGGTFYARTRLDSNKSGVYSPLFTFTSNYAQKKQYGAGMARGGEHYIVRAETDYANYSGGQLMQATRWCP